MREPRHTPMMGCDSRAATSHEGLELMDPMDRFAWLSLHQADRDEAEHRVKHRRHYNCGAGLSRSMTKRGMYAEAANPGMAGFYGGLPPVMVDHDVYEEELYLRAEKAKDDLEKTIPFSARCRGYSYDPQGILVKSWETQ